MQAIKVSFWVVGNVPALTPPMSALITGPDIALTNKNRDNKLALMIEV